jgi:predicted 2-oxoglutarate/Fe(II)-dependent dioxygenase YbiX
VLRAVNFNWNGDGWNLNANQVSNPNEWNGGNLILSSNYSIFSRLFGGSFV